MDTVIDGCQVRLTTQQNLRTCQLVEYRDKLIRLHLSCKTNFIRNVIHVQDFSVLLNSLDLVALHTAHIRRLGHEAYIIYGRCVIDNKIPGSLFQSKRSVFKL